MSVMQTLSLEHCLYKIAPGYRGIGEHVNVFPENDPLLDNSVVVPSELSRRPIFQCNNSDIEQLPCSLCNLVKSTDTLIE